MVIGDFDQGCFNAMFWMEIRLEGFVEGSRIDQRPPFNVFCRLREGWRWVSNG